MLQKVQEIREKTPKIILDSDAAPLLPTARNILEYVLRWLGVLMINEGTSFHEWSAQLPVALSSTFSQMSEPEVHFVEQAGHQMLSRWRKLEFFESGIFYSGRTDLASLFFAIQFRDRSSLSPDDIPSYPHFMCFISLPVDENDCSMVGEILLRMSEVVQRYQKPAESLIVWNMIVDDGDQNAIRALKVYNSDLRHYLGLELK